MYEGLDHYALQAFKGCHDRVRDGKCPSIFWPRDREGYVAFCTEIGPKPSGMVKPSVGRKEHSKGYQPGNIQWEEHKFNSVKRRGTKHENEIAPTVILHEVSFRKGTAEHLIHQRKASLARWAIPGQREAAKQRMLGNKHQKGERNAQG